MLEEARRRGVDLSIKLPSDHFTVPGDRDRLHQVLVNLLDNALKFTPRGGSVSLFAEPQQNGDTPDGIELVVADTGEGIPSSHIPRLTERFYRVDRARSRELGGTGLGLAIVKHIIQLHQGQLKIESRVREGTTVKVWLPLASPVS
jgi:two-component system phosphate regulon sensor histidine kinase PhoR